MYHNLDNISGCISSLFFVSKKSVNDIKDFDFPLSLPSKHIYKLFFGK